MSPVLTPSSGPTGEPAARKMYVSGGGNSLLEFRSEADEDLDALVAAQAPGRVSAGRLRGLLADRLHRRAVPMALLAAAGLTALLTAAFLWPGDVPGETTSTVVASGETASGAAAPVASATPRAPLIATGTLDISSDPPGARVLVDGVARGVTPVSLADMPPGLHEVSIVAGSTTINRSVRVAASSTATVLASVVPARSGAGWVAIEMPFEAEIVENGRILGTTSSERLALPAGWHELELRNATLGFQASLSVQVVPGQVSRPTFTTPTGMLSVNAIPWANVTIDGRAAGITPLGNISLPIGSHEVVLTHPQLGQQRQTVQVTGREPVRVGVTFGP